MKKSLKKYAWIAQIITTFILGILIVNTLILAYWYIPGFTDSTKHEFHVWASIIEEILKYGICLYVIYFDLKKNKYKYLILPLIGTGFGVGEQLSRLLFYNRFPYQPLCGHIFMALVMSYFFWRASKHDKFLNYSLALIIPMFIHIIYNITVVTINNLN